MEGADTNPPVITHAGDSGLDGAAVTRMNLASSRFFKKNHSLLTTQVNFANISKSAKLLKDLGWSSGFYLPFANKENRALEKKLEEKQRKLLNLNAAIQDNVDHIKNLEEHFQRSSEDIVVYQKVVNEKKSEIEHEKNFYHLAERQLSKVKQEKSKALAEIKVVLERNSSKESEKKIREKRVQELESHIEYDEELLKSYRKQVEEFDEEIGALMHIKALDQKRAEELESTQVDLGAERKRLRYELDQEAMNSSKYQEQFDRLSVEFRKVHKQRQEMVLMWASTIKTMKRKDDDMREIADEFNDVKEKLRRVMGLIEEKERILSEENYGIRADELRLSDIDRTLGSLRDRLAMEKDAAVTLKDAVLISQVHIHTLGSAAKASMEKLAEVEKEVKALTDKEHVLQDLLGGLRNQLNELEKNRNSSDDHVSGLEKLIDAEEVKLDRLVKEMELMKKYFWERSNEKVQLEKEIVWFDTRVARYRHNLSIMDAKEFSNMEYLARRSSQIYKLDLEASNTEMRINRMQDESIDPQYYVLQDKISELNGALEKCQLEKKFVHKEYIRLKEMYVKSSKDMSSLRTEEEHLKSEVSIIDTVINRVIKLIKKNQKEYQSTQVENSLEKVALKRINDELAASRDDMFSLAEHRNTIKWSVKERQAEIEMHKAFNISKSKALQEAVSKLRVQVSELSSRAEKLKGRFELVTLLMSGPGSGSEEEKTFAYQVRKAAREREGLQAERKSWENRVVEAEMEVKGLKHAWEVMKASNQEFKDSLCPAEEKSPEMKHLEALNEFEKTLMVRRSKAKKIKALLNERLDDLAQQAADRDQQIHSLQKLSEFKAQSAFKTDTELIQQKDKINRWTLINSKIIKEIKGQGRMTEEQMRALERDLKLRFTIEKLEIAIQTLEKILTQCPATSTIVYNFLGSQTTLRDILKRVRRRLARVESNNKGGFTRKRFHYPDHVHYEQPEEVIMKPEMKQLAPRTGRSACVVEKDKRPIT